MTQEWSRGEFRDRNRPLPARIPNPSPRFPDHTIPRLSQGKPQGSKKAREADNTPVSRSEEHTSELQSRPHLVCRLLLEKKKIQQVLSLLSHLASLSKHL